MPKKGGEEFKGICKKKCTQIHFFLLLHVQDARQWDREKVRLGSWASLQLDRSSAAVQVALGLREEATFVFVPQLLPTK